MIEIMEIVSAEINKVIQGASDLGRGICEADLICAKVNILNKLKEIN
ncbi:hypothetical protein LCGC14_1041150 [marine sediment metagenome]|uniref:Uncharacterized protein n=1 Tax=marine sediment metagenome TaxID=412755 RepID=A0A0F9NDD2_9ZZZZ